MWVFDEDYDSVAPMLAAKRLLPPRRSKTQVRVGEMVRRFRRARQVTVRDLAAKCGFSPSFISQVERGLASPSIHSTERIALALGVTLGDFFHAAAPSRPALTKAKDRPVLKSGWSRAKIESLGPHGGQSVLETMLVTLKPGGASASRSYARDVEQMIMVHRGKVKLHLEDEIHNLKEGDAVSIPSGIRHMWENVFRQSVQILIVTIRTNH